MFKRLIKIILIKPPYSTTSIDYLLRTMGTATHTCKHVRGKSLHPLPLPLPLRRSLLPFPPLSTPPTTSITLSHSYLFYPQPPHTQRDHEDDVSQKVSTVEGSLGIRPIVSGCSGPTKHISSFLDHIIKPLVSTMPSYIKNSPHFFSLLENTNIPSNAILVTIDVSSLYTNIPQDEGTNACLDAIEAVEASHIPRNTLRQLFDVVLRCNVFSFNGQIYQQIQGTAMGTKMAPSYTNLIMDRFE